MKTIILVVAFLSGLFGLVCLFGGEGNTGRDYLQLGILLGIYAEVTK